MSEERSPNTRVQRTRSSPSAPHSPLTRRPLGRLILLAAAITSGTVGAASSDSVPTAAAVLDEIKAIGPERTLQREWATEQHSDAICQGISTGAPDWLKVAVLLRPVSDGGASEAIDEAVARALPKAPADVLAVVGHGFLLPTVCVAKLIEPPPGAEQQLLEAAERALQSPLGAELESRRMECLALVRGELRKLNARAR